MGNLIWRRLEEEEHNMLFRCHVQRATISREPRGGSREENGSGSVIPQWETLCLRSTEVLGSGVSGGDELAPWWHPGLVVGPGDL